jgi:hypothetical protein
MAMSAAAAAICRRSAVEGAPSGAEGEAGALTLLPPVTKLWRDEVESADAPPNRWWCGPPSPVGVHGPAVYCSCACDCVPCTLPPTTRLPRAPRWGFRPAVGLPLPACAAAPLAAAPCATTASITALYSRGSNHAGSVERVVVAVAAAAPALGRVPPGAVACGTLSLAPPAPGRAWAWARACAWAPPPPPPAAAAVAAGDADGDSFGRRLLPCWAACDEPVPCSAPTDLWSRAAALAGELLGVPPGDGRRSS